MQPCPSDAALLQASADGLSSHLHECPTCASRLTDLREEEALLQRVRHLAASRTAWQAEHSKVQPGDLPSIDGFRVLRLIAEGGMGRVYEAEQLRPKRRVALKLLRAGRESEGHRCRLFQREADALARLRHPDIAVVYSAGETHAGDPFLAMELLPGETLDAYAAHHALLIDDILSLTARICRAVDHAHERGVIHRDLKPSNIMVDAHGNPKVLDFGLARIGAPDTGGMSSVTLDGRIAGTLAYMSPEQVCGRAGAVDARSDVYAIGVILFQLLTGKLPIETADRGFAEIVDAIRNDAPAAPSRLRAGVEPGVERIVLRALRKRPDERYRSARDLADDIDRCLAGAPIGAAAHGRSRRPATQAAVLVAIIVAAGAVWGGAWPRIAAPTSRAPSIASLAPEMDQDGVAPVQRLAPMITLAGDLSELETTLRARLAHLQNLPAPAAQETRAAQVRLALVLERQERYAEAERLFRDSIDDERVAPYRRIVAMVRIARCLGAQGDHEQAGSIFAECIRNSRRLGPQQAAVRTEIQVSMARDLMFQERLDDAKLLLEQAYAALDDSAPNSQWSRWSVTTALADCAKQTNEPAIEEAWRQRAAQAFSTPASVGVCQL